jgi:hypothetical protein
VITELSFSDQCQCVISPNTDSQGLTFGEILVRSAAPYMNLTCKGILFMMWRRVGFDKRNWSALIRLLLWNLTVFLTIMCVH